MDINAFIFGLNIVSVVLDVSAVISERRNYLYIRDKFSVASTARSERESRVGKPTLTVVK